MVEAVEAMMNMRSKVLQLLPGRLQFALPYMAIHRGPSLMIRPKKLNPDETLSIAEAAWRKIDFVRVDMCDSNRGPIIGEMARVPQRATGKFSPSHYDDWLGSFWKFNATA
jgi:hypothetical protein